MQEDCYNYRTMDNNALEILLRKIVREETEPIKQDIHGIKGEQQKQGQDIHGIKQDFQGLKQDVQELTQNVQGLTQDVQGLKGEQQKQGKDLQLIKKQNRKMQKNQDAILAFLNKEDMTLHKKVARIERHLNLAPIGN